jgi:large subunit ribosomal protein L30e
MDIEHALRTAINTGKVYFGIREAKKYSKKGDAKLLIVSVNCPYTEFKSTKYQKVPVYMFEDTNVALGAMCNKPFSISVVTIVDPGSSSILDLAK